MGDDIERRVLENTESEMERRHQSPRYVQEMFRFGIKQRFSTASGEHAAHRMHHEQPRYSNRRPYTVANYRWRADNCIEAVGLPKTQAGTPSLPSNLGIGWCVLENNATSTASRRDED